MNTKIKTLFFALFLVFSASVNAQDAPKKYEYATVIQSGGSLLVSYAGKPFGTVKLSDTKGYSDHHELLAYIEDLQNEGWQVFSFSENQALSTFVLRRLKK